jgi:tetratricopeptide (TPR) repeat protein
MAVEDGRAEEALDLLGRAVRIAPDHGPARLQLANAWSLSGRPEEARREVEAAIACPDLPPHLAEQARLFLADRRPTSDPGR